MSHKRMRLKVTSKLIRPNSWITQTVRQRIPNCWARNDESTSAESAATDANPVGQQTALSQIPSWCRDGLLHPSQEPHPRSRPSALHHQHHGLYKFTITTTKHGLCSKWKIQGTPLQVDLDSRYISPCLVSRCDWPLNMSRGLSAIAEFLVFMMTVYC